MLSASEDVCEQVPIRLLNMTSPLTAIDVAVFSPCVLHTTVVHFDISIHPMNIMFHTPLVVSESSIPTHHTKY